VAKKPRQLPPGGVLLTRVVANSNAARSGLRPRDVLLRYDKTELKGPADLEPLPAGPDAARRVPVTVWRGGKTLALAVGPGPLGVVIAPEPAPKALVALRRRERRDQLPGTRVEVKALGRLFDKGSAKLLLDSQASEQRLYELATSGELRRYRYLHLATHGEVDGDFPLRSAVVLSRDALPDPAKQLQAGRPVFDGRLTAEEVLRQWHLDSELVTLSACQTALGRYERGEGHVGFAQALILAGSRSVCLSLWIVDDDATALLMERFYQNLLGKRAGLKGPLPKAQALAEAKGWLRGLTGEEAARRAASLTKGVARGKGGKTPPPAGAKDDRPYAHPYYWAAFVLLGDPD
jgi:CHAT domain-containing protein